MAYYQNLSENEPFLLHDPKVRAAIHRDDLERPLPRTIGRKWSQSVAGVPQ
jgi:hypothetical protein